MSTSEKPQCPHCDQPMKRWRTPQFGTWSSEWLWVCFNDECSYFRDGWEHMAGQYNVCASFRHSLDPGTGAKGPLPVWSPTAHLGNLLPDDEEA